MADLSILKTCSKCNIEKPLSEFYADKKGKNDRSCHCKTCVKANVAKWQQSEAGRKKHCEACSTYYYSEHGKEVMRNCAVAYNATPAGRASQKRSRDKYRQTAKGKTAVRLANLTEAGKERTQRYAAKYPVRARARKRVNHLVESGQLPPVHSQTCAECPDRADGYHHHKGYAPPYDIDVIPLCHKHHLAAHGITMRPRAHRDSESGNRRSR